MLNAVLLVAHVGLSFAVVLFILLHRGQGGGLSDMFGGGAGGGLHGSAIVERNLDRLTIVTATAWTITTVLLGLRL